ncbi:hypothetical protein ACI2KR_07125 [Pseudomonas luteola]
MGNKVSIAAITSTILAISMQAHAGEKISVSQSDVGGDWADQVDKALRNKEPRGVIQMAMVGLAKNVLIDGAESSLDVSMILQTGPDSDSADGWGSTADPGIGMTAVTSCYSNCHSACHGSRSWR